MKVCHVCNLECEDSIQLCPSCGADLSTNDEQFNENIEEKTEENIFKEPQMVASFEDMVSAEIFEDILKDNNIAFTTPDVDDSVLHISFGGGFVAKEIYVDIADFEKAQSLYDEFLKSGSDFQDNFDQIEEE